MALWSSMQALFNLDCIGRHPGDRLLDIRRIIKRTNCNQADQYDYLQSDCRYRMVLWVVTQGVC